MTLHTLRLASSGFLLATVFMGAIGIPDTDQRKLPLAAISAILYTAWASRSKM